MTLELVWNIVKIIVVIITLIVIFNLITNISEYFSAQTKRIMDVPLVTSDKLSLDIRNDITVSMMNMIVTMISNEIILVLRSYITLNIRYDLKKLDDDIQNISTNVFNGIRSDVILDDNLIMTSDYMMKYIVSETTTRMIETIKKFNSMINM